MSIKNSLTINQLELALFVGWPDEERAKKQIVMLDINILYPNMPAACVTDALDDTFCYSELIQSLRLQLGDQSFRLIEHLTHKIFQILKSALPDQTKLSITLTKRPQIAGLGSVSFHYNEEV